MSFEVLYWTNSNADQYPTELTVSAEKGCLLRVTGSSESGPQRAVGVFWFKPSAQQLATLRRAVSAPQFAAGGEVSGILPGEVVRSIVVRAAGQPDIERVASRSAAADASFAGVESLLKQLEDQAYTSPEHATALSLSLQSATWHRDAGRVAVDLEIRNTGSIALAVPGPDAWDSSGVHFTVFMLRNDLPLAERRHTHQRFLEFGREQLEFWRPTQTAAPGSPVQLEPKTSVQLRLVGEANIAESSYDVWTELSIPLFDPEAQETVPCLVRSLRVKLKTALQ
jgi:hypothetical protein